MWLQKNQWDRKDGVNGIVAVAIDSDKGSQNALKCAIDHLLTKGSTVVLIHVKVKPVLSASPTISSSTPRSVMNGTSELGTNVCKDPDEQTKEIFLPYRVFCARKDIQCKDIVLEHGDVAKALTEYVSQSAIEHLVICSSNKSGFLKRFKVTDIPATVSKAAPDFCTVYVVTKGKIQSMRSASRAAPTVSPLQTQLSQASMKSDLSDPRVPMGNSVKVNERRSFDGPRRSQEGPRRSQDGLDQSFRSPFTRRGVIERYHGELPMSDSSDITFVRSSIDRLFPTMYTPSSESAFSNPRMSYSSDTDQNQNYSFESMHYGRRSMDIGNPDFSSSSHKFKSLSVADMEAQMMRLKLELKQTIEMYSIACKEALAAQQKTLELQQLKLEQARENIGGGKVGRRGEGQIKSSN